MPPRYKKSLCVSVAWTAWLMKNNPTISIIVASYSQNLSIKHSNDTCLVVPHPWYKDLFPNVQLFKEQNTKYKSQNTQRGFRLATSVGRMLTKERIY